MRAAVGHLSRKVKIRGEEHSTKWGGRVFSYLWRWVDENDSTNTANLRGQIIFDGVEFINMGQKDT